MDERRGRYKDKDEVEGKEGGKKGQRDVDEAEEKKDGRRTER